MFLGKGNFIHDLLQDEADLPSSPVTEDLLAMDENEEIIQEMETAVPL